MSVKMLWQDREWGRVAWFPYEILDLEDGETKVMWDVRANEPHGSPAPFLSKFPVRVQRTVSRLLRELALHLGDQEAFELSGKVLAHTESYELPPDIWDCVYGPTPGHGDDWFFSEEPFRDHEVLPRIPPRFTLMPYQSHTSFGTARRFYLDSLFQHSPYCWALQAIDALYRNGEDGIQYARDKLGACDWNGEGTKKWQWICPGDKLIPDPLPDICFPFGTGGTLPQEWVYKGDWVTPFFAASCLLYAYARRFGPTTIANEAKQWADESAEIVLKMQFPWTGKFENSDLGVVALPHAAGGFIDAYYHNSDGSLKQHGWIGRFLIAAEWGLHHFYNYQEQPTDTMAFGGYFENSLFGLHGLLLYRKQLS